MFCRVGLHNIFIIRNAHAASPLGADHTNCHGMRQAKRVPNGNHPFAEGG